MDKPATDRRESLFNQYKLYVELADKVSERRSKTNQFYISIISGLLAIMAFLIKESDNSILKNHLIWVLIAVCFLGLVLNVLWLFNIRSYRQLNSGKFKVIHEMEQALPFPCYEREWKFLSEGRDPKRYFQLTRVEKFLPMVLMVPNTFLLVYFLIQVIQLKLS
ncbi:MAG: hypothetical protein AAFX87_18735 [Bacteroidota bacterium]